MSVGKNTSGLRWANFYNRSHLGFTLPELLVTVLLSTLILSAVIMFFTLNNQQQLAVEQQVSRQEQQRFMAWLVTTSLQQACYSGCANLNSGVPVMNHGVASEQRLVPHHCVTTLAADDKNLPPFLQNKALAGSNIIWWHQASTETAALQHSAVVGEQQVVVDDSVKFTVGEAMMIANCQQVELLYIAALSSSSATASQTLTLNQPLRYRYDPQGTIVAALISRAFYVAATGRHRHDGSMVNALYQQPYRGDREELVADMDNLAAVRIGRLLKISAGFNGRPPFYVTVPLRENGP